MSKSRRQDFSCVDVWASFPQCLDNEYLPASAMVEYMNTNMSNTDWEYAQVCRQSSVKREFMRSLLYSPEVIVNRAYAVNEEAIIQCIDAHPRAMAKLMQKEKMHLLLFGRMNDSGWAQEESFEDFLQNATFPLEHRGKKAWTRFLEGLEPNTVPCVCMQKDEIEATGDRFAYLVKNLADDPDKGAARLQSCSWLSPADFRLDDARSFLQGEFKDWVSPRRLGEINRRAVYDAFVWRALPDSNGRVSRQGFTQEALNKFGYELKLYFDLGYNANIPVQASKITFVPEDLPDPSCLPRHLYKAPPMPDPLQKQRLSAKRDAVCALLQERMDAKRLELVYDLQRGLRVPDLASLTLTDVVDIREWQEWDDFKNAQDAVLSFASFKQLFELSDGYKEAIRALHEKMDAEFDLRKHWEPACDGLAHVVVQLIPTAFSREILPHHADIFLKMATKKTIAVGLKIVIGFMQRALDKVNWVKQANVSIDMFRALDVQAEGDVLAQLQNLDTKYQSLTEAEKKSNKASPSSQDKGGATES